MDIEQVTEELGKAFEQFKDTNDKRLKQLEKGGQVASDVTEKLEKIEQRMDWLQDQASELEKRRKTADIGNGDNEVDELNRRHLELFQRRIRTRNQDPEIRAELQKVEQELQKRDVLIATDAAGGSAVPEIIGQQIEQYLLEASPIRQVATVRQVGTSDYKELVDVRGKSFGWVGESGTRNKTDTPQLEECVPTMGTIYAYPQASEESLDDIFFDVGSWLVSSTVDAFAVGEGEAFTDGDGSNKPTGFLNGTPSAIVDDFDGSPTRAYPELQYVPTGVADGFGTLSTGSPENYPGDSLLDAVYALKAGHRANAMWAMNKRTLAVVRKFRDADGNYLWAPGLAAGQPSTLMGYGVMEWEAMPDIAANAFPVAIGDWRRGYLIADRVGLRITEDNNITTPGFVKWYVRRRLGGKVLNNQAIKLIKCATS